MLLEDLLSDSKGNRMRTLRVDMNAVEGISASITGALSILEKNRKFGSYGRKRFRWIIRAFASIGLLDLKRIKKVHWDINCWTSDEVMAWRQSYISNCSSIAIAVSTKVSLSAQII